MTSPHNTEGSAELSGWQPIETAPKGDGVLLWVANSYGHKHVKTGFVEHGVVRSVFDDGEALGYLTEECATHWMPLPKPPEAA